MKETIISSAVLILLICLLRAILKERASARLRYALWGLVLLRLLIPVSFAASPFSIMSVYERSELSDALVPVERVELPYVERNGYVAPELDPVQQKRDEGEQVPPFRVYVHEDADGERTTEYVFLQSWEELAAQYLPLVWLAGSALMAAWFLFANLRFRLRLRRSRERFEGVADCPLPLYLTGCIQSPCMTGLFRPAIYLTREAVSDEQRLRHVLAHESCHYRHGDHLWSLLRGLCLVLYWWNPLVWLAAVLSRIDGELACDEAAVARLGEDARAAYGHTLLDMSLLRQCPEGLLRASTSIGAGKREMRRRIAAIAAKRVKLTLAAVLALCLAIVFTGCAFLGSDYPPEEPDDEEIPTAPVDILESGEKKIILTYLTREGDILACRNEEGGSVYVHVNGTMSELELERDLDEEYYIVVTYDESEDARDRGFIVAKRIQVGVTAADLPEGEPLFDGCSYSVYRYKDGEVTVATGLEAEDDRLLSDVLFGGYLSSMIYPSVGIGALDDCFVFVLDDTGEETDVAEAMYAGWYYYVFRQGEQIFTQTPGASMRYPLISKTVTWETLEALMEEQGVPLEEAEFRNTPPLIPTFGERGDFSLTVGATIPSKTDIVPYSVFQSSKIWTEDGWVFGDGKYLDLEAVAQYAPEMTYQGSLRTNPWSGYSRWTFKELTWRLYSEDLEEIYLEEPGNIGILNQMEGRYLVRLDTLLEGRFIASEGEYEQEMRSWFFWLQIP